MKKNTVNLDVERYNELLLLEQSVLTGKSLALSYSYFDGKHIDRIFIKDEFVNDVIIKENTNVIDEMLLDRSLCNKEIEKIKKMSLVGLWNWKYKK